MKNKNITPRNENGNRHGYWEYYYDNGNLNQIIYYIR
jgi:antitoxin component YwqK of YwqJK toxin-antitoxin module